MLTICNYFFKYYGNVMGMLPEKIVKQAPLLGVFFLIQFAFSQLDFRIGLYMRLVLVT